MSDCAGEVYSRKKEDPFPRKGISRLLDLLLEKWSEIHVFERVLAIFLLHLCIHGINSKVVTLGYIRLKGAVTWACEEELNIR